MAEEPLPVEEQVEETESESEVEEPKPVEEELPDVAGLTCNVKDLTDIQRKALLSKHKEKNDHPFYEIKTNRKGITSIHKRKQTVAQEVKDIAPTSVLTDTQMLQALVMDLDRKIAKLHGKHKKLKNRVNIIDEETMVIEEEPSDIDEPEEEYEPPPPPPKKHKRREETYYEPYYEQPRVSRLKCRPTRTLRSLFG